MFSENVRVLRAANSMSMRELSRQSDVAVGTLHIIEKHPFEKKADPRLSTLGKIAEAFALPSASHLTIGRSWVRPWLEDDESLIIGSSQTYAQHVISVRESLIDVLAADRLSVAKVIAVQGAPVRVCKEIAKTEWAIKE
jgi:transcriptional regulator with XRE-family HTH domain